MHSNPKNLQVLYEDNHLLVVNKRAGDLVQGDQTGDQPLSEVAKAYLALRYDKKGRVFLGVVHRLDRPTTGIVVFARTSKALERLNKMFREKKVRKTYWALVENELNQAEGTLISYLRKNPKNNKSTAFPKETKDAKKAILHYRTVLKLERYTLLEINLETGRHHQIRCQLAAMGNPIKGDLKYGSKRSNKDGGIHLHALSIGFIHPVKQVEVLLSAPLPDESVWNLCAAKLPGKADLNPRSTTLP